MSDSESDKAEHKAMAVAKALAKAGKDAQSEEAEDEGPAPSEGETEEEYEIEAILGHKRGAFPGGRMGFFVKWKGYGEEENSWVDEADAGNAAGLIEEYWRNYRKENKGGRKPSTSKPKSVSKQPRKSRDAASNDGSPARKRIRTGKDKESIGRDASDVEEEARKVKKQRKSNGTTTSKTTTKRVTKTPEPEDGDGDAFIGNMDKHNTIPTWDHLIQSVETVERSGGVLFVYFILKTGERVKEPSARCAEKFPRKLIDFYESNLKWKIEDDTVE